MMMANTSIIDKTQLCKCNLNGVNKRKCMYVFVCPCVHGNMQNHSKARNSDHLSNFDMFSCYFLNRQKRQKNEKQKKNVTFTSRMNEIRALLTTLYPAPSRRSVKVTQSSVKARRYRVIYAPFAAPRTATRMTLLKE